MPPRASRTDIPPTTRQLRSASRREEMDRRLNLQARAEAEAQALRAIRLKQRNRTRTVVKQEPDAEEEEEQQEAMRHARDTAPSPPRRLPPHVAQPIPRQPFREPAPRLEQEYQPQEADHPEQQLPAEGPRVSPERPATEQRPFTRAATRTPSPSDGRGLAADPSVISATLEDDEAQAAREWLAEDRALQAEIGRARQASQEHRADQDRAVQAEIEHARQASEERARHIDEDRAVRAEIERAEASQERARQDDLYLTMEAAETRARRASWELARQVEEERTRRPHPAQPPGLAATSISVRTLNPNEVRGVRERFPRPRERAIEMEDNPPPRVAVRPRPYANFYFYFRCYLAVTWITLVLVLIWNNLLIQPERTPIQGVIPIHQPTLDLENGLGQRFETSQLRENLKYAQSRVQFYCKGLYEWDELQSNRTGERRVSPEDDTLKHRYIFKTVKTEENMDKLAIKCYQMEEYINFLLERPADALRTRALEDLVVVSDENVNRLNDIITYQSSLGRNPEQIKSGFQKEIQWRSISAYIMSMDKLKRDAATHTRSPINMEEERKRKRDRSSRSDPSRALVDTSWHVWLRLHLGSSLEVAKYWNDVSMAMTQIVPAFTVVEEHVLSSCFDSIWVKHPLCPTSKPKPEIPGKKQEALDWFSAYGKKAQKNAHQISGALDRIDLQRGAFTDLVNHLCPKNAKSWLENTCEVRIGRSLEERGIANSDWGWVHPNFNVTGLQMFSSLPFCASHRLFDQTDSPCPVKAGTTLWVEIWKFFNVRESEEVEGKRGLMHSEFYEQKSLWLKLASVLIAPLPTPQSKLERVWRGELLPWTPVTLPPAAEQIEILKEMSTRIRNAQLEEINSI